MIHKVHAIAKNASLRVWGKHHERIVQVGLAVVFVLLGSTVEWYIWHSGQAASAAYDQAARVSSVPLSHVSPTAPGALGDATVSTCPISAATACTVFTAKYQFGLAYPAGWSAQAGTTTTASNPQYNEQYYIHVEPTGQQDDGYVRVAVLKGNITALVAGKKQQIEDKDGQTVAVADTTVNGKSAVRLDYMTNLSFVDGKQPVSEYFIADQGYVYMFDYVLRANTSVLSTATTQTIFASLQLP